MIDTIRGYIDISKYNYSNFEHLIEREPILVKDKGFTISINLSNFKITLKFDSENKPLKLYFYGSLPKFYFGNNLAQLDWVTTKEAIQELSNNLNIEMNDATLTRIDFGINIILNKPIHDYISNLLNYKNFAVLRFKDSVTFISKSQSLIFYDKLKEMKKNDKTTYFSIPEEYCNKNILRYEIQLKSILKQRLKLDSIQIKDLFIEENQKTLVKIWLNCYYNVDKLHIETNPLFLTNKHNGIMKYLSFYGIEKLGLNNIFNFISELKFDVKNQIVKRSKMKTAIKELLKEVKENTLEENNLTELDNKIEFIKEIIL